MKTQSKTHILVGIVLLTIGVSNIADVKADNSGFIYNNRAYVHAINNAPNPIADHLFQDAKIVYVNPGYGQAIYSYPTNVAYYSIDFNVEYIDTAYSQAIYSYPSNNVRYHLDLSEN